VISTDGFLTTESHGVSRSKTRSKKIETVLLRAYSVQLRG